MANPLPLRHPGPCLLMAMALLTACRGEAPAPVTPETVVVSAPSAAEPMPVLRLPQGNLEAVALDLGVALDADGRVATPVARVRPRDTVHVSLVTIGDAPAAMLGVRWRDAAGQVLGVDERAIRTEGPAVHTFSRTPKTGWPPGRYEVEVSVGAQSAGVRAFEVR